MLIDMQTVKNTARSKKQYIFLGCILLIALVFYTINATRSGLWYDEAIEYFYSKYMTGPVPGGRTTGNMLERILRTFQPPLYNILMYFWLAVFDSEFGFRFAGILVTLAGAVGCFFAINEIHPEGVWGAIGTAFYLFTTKVVYYGLECAEYNLVLCFIAWTIYFFLRVLKRSDNRSLLGFFIFACLSAYSQYGAAFIILGMFISIFLFFIWAKNYSALGHYIKMTIVTLFVAVIPLFAFFLIPQILKQGATSVSHAPFFQQGPVIDFFNGIGKTVNWLFGDTSIAVEIILLLMLCFALFVRPRIMLFSFLSVLTAWILYFAAVSCSFYGYNSWNRDSLGTMNLGGRYSLIFIPGVVVIFILSSGIVADWVKERNRGLGICLLICILLYLPFYSSRGINQVNAKRWIKDDIREASSAWYECEAYRSKTLVHQWDDALFNFYLNHDKRYDKSYTDSIEDAGVWIRSADHDAMKQKLSAIGYLTLQEYYFVTPKNKSYETFLEVVAEEGYSMEEVYAGKSILLHLQKD